MASGFEVASDQHLIRSNLWQRQIKTLLLDELFAMKFVRMLTDFPDGTTLNIPSIGEAETFDYEEGQAVKYSRMDTGNFTFAWDQYKGSANSISEKFKMDSYYAQEVLSSFVPKEHRALMEAVETRIFNRANAGQTASDKNAINGADHRLIGSGTNETIAFVDFMKSDYALQKANVPLVNKVAVVDPSVAYTLGTQTNVVNLLSPRWGDMISKNMVNGTRFSGMNVYGYDIYVSNYLPRDIAETVVNTAGVSRSTTVGVANFLFSAAEGDVKPLIGGFKQMPTVYSEFNKDLQQTEYLTICRYGFKLYRPENMVIILTDTDQVS